MPAIVQPPPVQASVGAPPEPPLRLFLTRAWAFIKITPLTALAIYTILSLAIEENYPFSNYPMYSNPSTERPYYMVADGDGNAIPVQKLTGITCPKIGKIYRKKAEEAAKKADIKAKDLPPQAVQQICDEMFAQLRHEASGKGQTLPSQLKLIKSYISYRDGKVVEDVELIGAETLANASQPKPEVQ